MYTPPRMNARRGFPASIRVVSDAERTDHAGLHGMQAAELYDNEEQDRYAGSSRDPEILPF